MVTARFKVGRVTLYTPTDPAEFAEKIKTDLPKDEYGASAEIEMVPDYAGGKNKEWSSATPSGVIRMTVSNHGALRQLVSGKPGKSFDVTLEASDE